MSAAPPRVLVLHGPNLNLLGQREPGIYGSQTLGELDASLRDLAAELGAEVTIHQSNHEGQLIDWIHGAVGSCDGIVINPGGYTHTSVAIRDALAGVALPFIEIHLSNPHSREPFRHTSYLSDKAVGVVCGFGADSYRYALDAALQRLPA